MGEGAERRGGGRDCPPEGERDAGARRQGGVRAMACLALLVCVLAGGAECTEGGGGGEGHVLGDWARDPEAIGRLAAEFQGAMPFPNVVISNFFSESMARRIDQGFPTPMGPHADEWREEGWHVYDNPIEGKLALDDVGRMERHDDVFREMWRELQSSGLVAILSNVTGIEGLENDPHLHGAGLHYHPPGSRLEMHLDYSIHPLTGKERRVNLIVYMNRDWQDEWGGELNLWEGTPSEMTRGPVHKIAPRFNQAALFRTSDISWHGMPDPVACPEGRARKSVAIYYVSDPRPEASPRYKAAYKPRPTDPIHSSKELGGYQQLCETRRTRRLDPEDVQGALPEWTARWSKQQMKPQAAVLVEQ